MFTKDINGELTAGILLPSGAVTADGNGAGLDLNGYTGELAVVLNCAAATAGTNPTMDVLIQDSPAGNLISNIAYGSNTGTGKIQNVIAGPDAIAETFTLTASNATTIAVSGGTTGSLGNATVGTQFTSAQVSFKVVAGGVAWQSGDTITFDVAVRTYTNISGSTPSHAVDSYSGS